MRTSSNTTSAVCDAWIPIFLNFWPMLTPGVPGGTMNDAWPRLFSSGSTDGDHDVRASAPS